MAGSYCFSFSNYLIPGKMKYFGFMAIITCLLVMACSDNKRKLELRGKVLDEKTKSAIPYRRIIVQALVQRDNKLMRVYAGEFCTDSSGYFAYSLRNIDNNYLFDFCIVGDSSYAFSNNRLGLTELSKYGKFLTFYLTRLTDLTISIESRSNKPYYETLYLSWKSDGIDGKKIYPYTIKNYGIKNYSNTTEIPFKWVGGDIKSTIKTKVYADKETTIRWELFRNRKTKVVRDTIFCKRDVSNYVYFNY
jgi:hypothetical protein